MNMNDLEKILLSEEEINKRVTQIAEETQWKE